MEGLVWSHEGFTAVGLETKSFHEFGSTVFVVFSPIIGKGDGMGEENMGEWVGQYGRGME